MDAPVKKELDDIFAYIISCQIPFQDKINYFIFSPRSLSNRLHFSIIQNEFRSVLRNPTFAVV